MFVWINQATSSARRVSSRMFIPRRASTFPSLASTHDWLLSKDLYLCQSFIGNITKGLAGKSEPPNLLQVDQKQSLNGAQVWIVSHLEQTAFPTVSW